MANTNYISGMGDPYGTWQPDGFLSGMMYPDRMQDYRTRRDLQNRGLGLANDTAAAQLETYNLDAPVRGAQRTKTLGDLSFEEEMRPTKQAISKQTTLAELDRLPFELQAKFVEALYNKDDKNFKKNAQELMQIQALISPFGDVTDENYDTIVALAERAGMDMTRYWDYADEFTSADTGNLTGEPIGDGDAPKGTEGVIAPTVNVAAPTKKTKKQLMQELNFLRRLNPEVFKFDNTMTKEKYEQEQQNQRLLQQLSSAERIAAMQSKASGGGAQKTLDKIMAAAYSGLTKMKSGQTPTPEEAAAMQYMNFHNTAKAETAIQGKMQTPGAIIDSLKPENQGTKPEFSSSANLPVPNEQLGPQSQSADIQVGKEMTIGGKKYKIVRIDPDGAPVLNVDGQLRRIKPKGKQ